MMSLLGKYAAVWLVAWNASSIVTIGQLSVFKQVLPDQYHWVMDTAGSVLTSAWALTVQCADVCWEFLNTS